MGRRIAHIVELSRGGPTTVVVDLIRDQRARGDTPVLIACRDLISDELRDETGTNLLYTSSRSPARIPGVAREVARLIDRAEPDIVHLHSAFPGLYGRMALPKLTGPRPGVVYSSHGWAFTQDVPSYKKMAYATVERRLLARTDAIINSSQSEARAARAWGILCGNDHTILNGVRDRRPGKPADLGLDPGVTNLAFFGRFDRQKGVDLLLRAWAETPRPDMHLTLIGSALRGDQSGLAPTAGVTLRDWVTADTVDAHMSAFDMIVMPSRWEAFGLVAAEAMRNGKPLLVSDRGALPELVLDGFNGVVFPMDDPSGLSHALDRLGGLDLVDMGRNALAVSGTLCNLKARLADTSAVYDGVLER